ncbi:MAG: TonB-dependent receptor plug domain-containing protein, partial [Gemmatimonadetes bacterium]|nr:TonB-dependent receptor plug domain-containing protein [Gemmatimonadota bacterium]
MKHLFLVTFALIALSPSIQASDATSPDDLYDLSLGELVHINVVSASLEEEPLRETPVPVTVITQTMIHDSGARHLKDLLTLYVPGFTAVEDQNELNVAARGVFTSSQQKILVMVDGHRLNSRSYSMASPDYGIALHKIQQIEILRGPASSLYGNVSLTAAVNIVLKKGADILGGEASIGVGDHGQQLLQGLYGSQLADRWDVLLWGQFYEADGQSIDIAAVDIYSAAPPVDGGSAILDGFTDKPSYDVGAKLGDEHLGLLVNWRRGHYIEPFTGGGLTGEVYDFSEYDPVHGYG